MQKKQKKILLNGRDLSFTSPQWIELFEGFRFDTQILRGGAPELYPYFCQNKIIFQKSVF